MFDEARLNRLIAAYFDQQLDATERAELEAMLLGSSRARGIFLDHAEWHGLTREWALREGSLEQAATPPAVSKPKARRVPRALWIPAAIAACLALAWTGYQRSGTPAPDETIADVRHSSHGDDVAMLGQMAGIVWGDDMPALVVGSPLPKGWLHIRAGTLRLDFYSGATVILNGPASLGLISPDLVRLDKGRLTANVPPPAEGFTVLSADLRVVDRGTEFGMSVEEPGACEVHVFKGEIELQGDVPASAKRELRQGNALAIRNGEATHIEVDRKSFTDLVSLHRIDMQETAARWKNWRESANTFRTTPDLLTYFDFEDLAPGVPIVPNRASGANSNSYGTIVGCDRLSGRWPEKGSLGFTRTSDRVRFRLSGTTSSLTLMAWVRVDSLLLEHASLLSMSPDEVGEIHWKMGKSGRLLLGLRASTALRFDSWERLESPVVVTERNIGRWMHFATVIDGEKGMMKHFVNGEQVASRPISRSTPVRLGLANLGNFDPSSPERAGKHSSGRSFNGRFDEFAMIGRSLTDEQIKESAR